ncbi:MAG: hypothetical protein IT210_12375 [Armatimonadetes bacterium]|nr:hypothetical protein [Armatimonadota bacterium]
MTALRPFHFAVWIVSLTALSLTAAPDHRVLPENIRIHATPYFENTARVADPGPRCSRGAIVVATGQPRNTARLLTRPLLDAQGAFDTSSSTEEKEYPVTPGRAIATDNQIVRLTDGSLLCFKDAYLWEPIDAPWKEERVTGSGDHIGQRGGELVWHSEDGGQTWEAYPPIDFGRVLGGKYGVPRPMSDAGAADVPADRQGQHPDGKRRWWVGGCDRTEVYVCPFTGYVYLSTRVISGPYGKDFPQYNTLLLFSSRDRGRTWQALKEDFPAWSPLVMTSTPDGRLFCLQIIGEQPTLYFTLKPVGRRGVPVFSPGYPVFGTENGAAITSRGGESVDLFHQIALPSISRASAERRSSAVRVAYQIRNEQGMQEALIVKVIVKNPAKAPQVALLARVRAENPEKSSVMYFAFIDPDRVGLGRRPMPDTSVLYWVEAPARGAAERRYAARYAVFSGDSCSAPAYLSVKGGQPRAWAVRQDLGDYMTGGFFYNRKDRSLNYLAQWVEPEGIVANIVTVKGKG